MENKKKACCDRPFFWSFPLLGPLVDQAGGVFGGADVVGFYIPTNFWHGDCVTVGKQSFEPTLEKGHARSPLGVVGQMVLSFYCYQRAPYEA